MTSPYLVYFVFVPRIASSLRKVIFGEIAVMFLCCSKKKCINRQNVGLSCKAPVCYLTFVSSTFFNLSDGKISKKSIFICCSVLTYSAKFCIMLLFVVSF